VAWPPVGGGAVYPFVYFDALVVKVNESHQVRNKAADIAVGRRHRRDQACVGGVQITEGATCWAGVLAELRNRGVADVLIACYGGVTGLPGGDRGDMAAECGADLCGASDQGLDAVCLLQRP
jgi:putative transposase